MLLLEEVEVTGELVELVEGLGEVVEQMGEVEVGGWVSE